jgi:cathepsin L
MLTDSVLQFKFMNYLMEHGKNYQSIDEYMMRFENFVNVEAFIVSHSETNASYAVAHNHLSDWTQDEVKMLRGRLESTPMNGETLEVGAFDASVDWREHNAVTPVKDQGQCGSCWTFGTTGAMEGAVAVKTGTLYSFSEQALVDCVTADYGCGGGLQTDALTYLETHDAILEDDYSYTGSGYGTGADCQYDSKAHTEFHTTGNGYTMVESSSVAAYKSALTTMPVTIGIDASGIAFQTYSHGNYDNTKCSQSQLDHAVLFVGYGADADGTEYWILKNSWATTWGIDGYMHVLMGDDGPGVCGVLTDGQTANIA